MPDKTRIHVYLGSSFRKLLAEAAERENLSMASYVRRAVLNQVKKDTHGRSAVHAATDA